MLHKINFKTVIFFICLAHLLGGLLGGCKQQLLSKNEKGWFGKSSKESISGSNLLQVQWSFRLGGNNEGSFIPVETAFPAFDPKTKTLWIGSSSGFLYQLTLGGHVLTRLDADGPVESKIAHDFEKHVVYGATAEGSVFAFDIQEKKKRWTQELNQPIRIEPVLDKDVVFVFSDNDKLFALSQSKGKILWEYERKIQEDFSVTGHSGLSISDGKVFVGFTDGIITALDASDGSVVWEKDTSVDAVDPVSGEKKWIDVDTTPIVEEEKIYAASFSGGLYALSKATGDLLLHMPQLKGITSLTKEGNLLLISSASEGLIGFDFEKKEKRWTRVFHRGVPGKPVLVENKVFITESQGDFLMLSAKSGQELSRISSSHGFASQATVIDEHQGLVLSNGGTLFSFSF